MLALTFKLFLGFNDPVTNCTSSLGIQSKDIIPDQAITASSVYTSDYVPEKARFANLNEGWQALYYNTGQWIQVDLGNITKVTGVATRGVRGLNKWVTKYVMSYSLDDGPFMSYENDQVSHYFVVTFIYMAHGRIIVKKGKVI